MIIWIDGTYGVGKTSVAEALLHVLNSSNAVHLDADEYYLSGIKNLRYIGGGILPQNNERFIADFKAVITKKASNPEAIVVVTMALTMAECRDNLLIPLQLDHRNLVHIILKASEETIISRIDGDSRRDKDWAKSFLRRNIKFLSDNYSQAIWIDTDTMTPESIAEKIKGYVDGVK